jgi:hypothetical protein
MDILPKNLFKGKAIRKIITIILGRGFSLNTVPLNLPETTHPACSVGMESQMY